MPLWNVQTIIADIDFSQCRATILDGANFVTAFAGSVALAADGMPHPQRVNRGVKGIPFGVRMANAEATSINSMRAAVQTAEGAALAFRVQLQNALYTLDVWAIPDYNQQTWLTHGDEIEGMIPDVNLRFIAVAQFS